MQMTSRGGGETKVERGQGLLEFALVISFLLLLLFGIIDFSRLFFTYATMSNGVREGARYGVVHPGQDTAIIDHAEAMMIIIGGTANVAVDYPVTDADGDPYCPHFCQVVVRAESTFDVWTPVIPTFPIVAQATMHIE
jgi:hypothetical protein